VQVPWSCRTYFFQPEYEKYLQKRGYLDAVPDLTEVNYLNLGMEEVRKELVGMKNREGTNKELCLCYCGGATVHQFSVDLVVHSFGWDLICLLGL